MRSSVYPLLLAALFAVLCCLGTVQADNNECPYWPNEVTCNDQGQSCDAEYFLDRDVRTDSTLCNGNHDCFNTTCQTYPFSAEGDSCELDTDCWLSYADEKSFKTFDCALDGVTNTSRSCIYTRNNAKTLGCRSVGDNCFVDTDCYGDMVTCSNGVCVGAAQGEDCTWHYSCAEGLFCEQSTSVEIISSVSVTSTEYKCQNKFPAGTNTTEVIECASGMLHTPNGVSQCLAMPATWHTTAFAEECSLTLQNTYGVLECEVGLYCNSSSVCDVVEMTTCSGSPNTHFRNCYNSGGLYGECMCDHVGGEHTCFEVQEASCWEETLELYAALVSASKCQQPIGNTAECASEDRNSEWAGTCAIKRATCAEATHATCIRNTIDNIFFDALEVNQLCGNSFPVNDADYQCQLYVDENALVIGDSAIAAAIGVPVGVLAVGAVLFFVKEPISAALVGVLACGTQAIWLINGLFYVAAVCLLLASVATMHWADGAVTGVGLVDYGLFEVCAADICTNTIDSLSLTVAARDTLAAVQGLTMAAVVFSCIGVIVQPFITFDACGALLGDNANSIMAKVSYVMSLLITVLCLLVVSLFAAFHSDEDGLSHEYEPAYGRLQLSWSWGLVLVCFFTQLVGSIFAYRLTTFTNAELLGASTAAKFTGASA